MKSLSQTLILMLILFIGYLYMIHDSTNSDALIADLEARAGSIDVQERKIEDLKEDIYEEIKKYNSDSKNEVDSLTKQLSKLNSDLAYNQKVRRLNGRSMTTAEEASFDSTKIIPFQVKIERIEERLETLSPPDTDNLKQQIKEELRVLLEQKKSLNRTIVNYSTHFFKAPAVGNRVVVENGLDVTADQ